MNLNLCEESSKLREKVQKMAVSANMCGKQLKVRFQTHRTYIIYISLLTVFVRDAHIMDVVTTAHVSIIDCYLPAETHTERKQQIGHLADH